MDYLYKYLSHTDNSTPRCLRRVKRMASRRLRRRPISKEFLQHFIHSDLVQPKPNQLSSSSNNHHDLMDDSQWTNHRRDCDYKKTNYKWNLIQENLNEDCASSLSSSCTCEDSESTDSNNILSSDDDYEFGKSNQKSVLTDSTLLGK